MKIILSKIIIAIAIFISLTLSANALKLEENNSYSGTIKDNHRNNIPLPPGEWLLTEIKNTKLKGRGVTAGIVDYYFNNPSIGNVYYFGPTGTSAAGDHWSGRKTPSLCNDSKSIAGKTKISGINNSEWCVFDDGQYIEFRNFTALNFEQYKLQYFVKKNLLKDTSKVSLQSIGQRIFDQVKRNKSGDISFLSNFLDFNKSPSQTLSEDSKNISKEISDYSDGRICLQVTSFDGCSWMKFPKKYYNEALERGLSLKSCNKVTNRGIYSDCNSKLEKDTANGMITIETKLKKLKKLFNQGLITQDQYDKKSIEILEEL